MIEEPNSEVRFQSNGEPEVTITVQVSSISLAKTLCYSVHEFKVVFVCFQPPAICTYQYANLSIQVIEDNNRTEPTIAINMQTYSGEPSVVSVVYSSADGLVLNADYRVLAEVESVTGSVSAEAMFGMLGRMYKLKCKV